MSLISVETTLSSCPNCHHPLDRARCVDKDGAIPQPDDMTLCLHCDHLMAFASNLQFRELTDQEMTDVAGDPIILLAQRLRAQWLTTQSLPKTH